MRFWFSPLPLLPSVVEVLVASGLQPWPTAMGRPDPESCVLVYDSPDEVIMAAAAQGAPLCAAALSEGYAVLMRCTGAHHQPLLAGWRLRHIDASELRRWLSERGTCHVQMMTHQACPLTASVILGMSELQPNLLESYTKLELQADLLGSEAELNYRQRLLDSITQADPLAELIKIMNKKSEAYIPLEHFALKDKQPGNDHDNTQEEARLTALQSYQAHEELEQLLGELEQHLIEGNKKQQHLETRNQELKSLQELQSETNNLVGQLETRNNQLANELDNSREELTLTLLQLHQVQEQLEQLFLEGNKKQQHLETRNQELKSLQELQSETNNLVEQLETRNNQLANELDNSREELELTLLQLHQVQEELEHFFLCTRSATDLANAQADQLFHAKRLLEKLSMKNHAITGAAVNATFEVLTPHDIGRAEMTLEVQALLENYSSALSRAHSIISKTTKNQASLTMY